MSNRQKITLTRAIPLILLIGGLIGTLASAILFQEHLNALKDPNYVPACNLNPIFSCSTVSGSDQATAFGIYNGFLGLPGFAIVSFTGLALLAGANFKRWLWRLVNLGLLFAVGFVTWLQFETLERIGALCIFCMVIWAVTIPMFWYLTLYNLEAGNITPPANLKRLAAFARRHHADVLIVWYLIIILVILHRFWYYWKTLF